MKTSPLVRLILVAAILSSLGSQLAANAVAFLAAAWGGDGAAPLGGVVFAPFALLALLAPLAAEPLALRLGGRLPATPLAPAMPAALVLIAAEVLTALARAMAGHDPAGSAWLVHALMAAYATAAALLAWRRSHAEPLPSETP